MSVSSISIEQLAINTIRTLGMDGVQAANSGHPGTPMALAPVAYSVWNRVLRYDPAKPNWLNRDRFVLSAGHASMLIYSMIHLTGIKKLDHDGNITSEPALSLDDLRNFRQLDSLTPGHPEFGHTTGVETTTGPLGQGLGNSVGMAIANQYLASRYNKPGYDIFNYDVYAICGDGDLMEGVAAEAASLAGHLKLPNLCWIYDNNNITIEGNTDLAFSEDVATRFAGYGWNTIHVQDANDVEALSTALQTFKDTNDRPTLIIVDSVIGWGSPNKANTHGAHGAPLGDEEIQLTKAAYGWPTDEKFLVPEEVLAHFQEGIGARGATASAEWEKLYEAYKAEHPETAAELEQVLSGELAADWDKDLTVFPTDEKGMATRKSDGLVLNDVAKAVPGLLGGSADLAPSNLTLLTFEGTGDFGPEDYSGRNFHFGIREHGMGAVMNGMATVGLRPYGSTFLVFSDYVRPSMRLSALMEVPAIYIFTHDSIGVGEDGPTHQPIEHVASLRIIPNMVVLRPGDANEVTECWKAVMPLKKSPASFVLTRQNLPTLDREKYACASGAQKGAYVLADNSDGNPDIILMASGSELQHVVGAYEALVAEGVKARVVSMPSWELFEMQDDAYKAEVFPASATKRLAMEAGSPFGWERYTGIDGKIIGLDHFGASAPAGQLFERFGFTAENVVKEAKALLG